MKKILSTAVASVALVAGGGFTALPAEAGGWFKTIANVNLRRCQWVNNGECWVLTTIPNNTTVYLNCWAYGTSVNGDNIWYNSQYGGHDGMLAGYYVNTGADPNPSVSRCP